MPPQDDQISELARRRRVVERLLDQSAQLVAGSRRRLDRADLRLAASESRLAPAGAED